MLCPFSDWPFCGHMLSFLRGKYLKPKSLGDKGMISFIRNCQTFISKRLHDFILFTNTIGMLILSNTLAHIWCCQSFLTEAPLVSRRWYLTGVFICMSRITRDTEQVFTCSLPFIFLLWSVCSNFPHFMLTYLFFCS